MSITEVSGNPAAKLLIQNVRIFLEVQNAYAGCDAEIRKIVDEMTAIFTSQTATDDERDRALITIVEAIFPSLAVDFLGICEAKRQSASARERANEMDEEEKVFAERVNARMLELDLKQDDLAQRTGVGQSAISNMLNRQCRPQRRTIKKIAQALDVSPTDLWPGFDPDAD